MQEQLHGVLPILHTPFDGNDAYLAVLRGLNRTADRVTGVVQNGSLPVYSGVVLLTATVVPGQPGRLFSDCAIRPADQKVPASSRVSAAANASHGAIDKPTRAGACAPSKKSLIFKALPQNLSHPISHVERILAM